MIGQPVRPMGQEGALPGLLTLTDRGEAFMPG